MDGGRERGADAAWLTELHYPVGAIAQQVDLAGAEVVIRPMWPWVVNYLPVAEVDRDRRVIRTALPATYPQARLAFDGDGAPTAWIESTLAGITGPGRWALDRAAGRLYLWPPSDGPTHAIEAPHLTELVRVAGEPEGSGRGPVRGIHLEGITLIHGDRELCGAWTTPACSTTGICSTATTRCYGCATPSGVRCGAATSTPAAAVRSASTSMPRTTWWPAT